MLRQDSVRLQALNEEIQNLKSFLGTSDLSDSASTQVQSSVQEKIEEKASLDNQISEKLAMLDKVQSDLDNQPQSSGNSGMVIFLVILGAIVIILIVVLVMVLMNKPKQQIPPPWMMYPPRRPKKKVSENQVNVTAPQATPPQTVPVQTAPEDIAVLQSEVNDMKQAVVSMSVGQPQAATKIVKDWILEEAPPEPEMAPATPESEDDGDKKKKKKKKK